MHERARGPRPRACARSVMATLAGVLSAAFCSGGATAGEPPARPAMVERSDWGGVAANEALMKRQTPREIIIHHTGIRQQPNLSLEKKLRGLQSFSMRPGKVGSTNKPAWGDVPYHYYIAVSGRIGEGRSTAFAGDTNTRYDVRERIQIVLEGHFDSEVPSPGQVTSLIALLQWLAVEHAIPASAISGHNDHAPTDCPGKHLKQAFGQLRAAVAAVTGQAPKH